MENEIVNRVANSSLLTFDLEQLRVKGDRVVYDLKDVLFQGMILREKDFRDHVRDHEWSKYEGKLVAVTCTADAIVPTWAYMLVAVALKPFARRVCFGSLEDMEDTFFTEALNGVDWEQYRGARVVVKGCSDALVPVAAYVEATGRLAGVAASIMYGEPCSTVPIFKKPKTA